jgi:hypothetical protein
VAAGATGRRRGAAGHLAASAPLTRVEKALTEIVADLADLGRQWALVGGFAVAARAEPRFTRDADLAVGVVDDRDAEHLVHALQARGHRVVATVEQEATGRLATVRLATKGAPEQGVVIDLLFASSGIETEVIAGAERMTIVPGLDLPVARLGHLVALKVLSRDDRTRAQDRADLVALLARAHPADLDQARHALHLITERGFHRGRALVRELEAFLAEPESPEGAPTTS